ncbi:hypothetical protein [Duganella sp. Root336D2]|uniref:hypothetical protein n=1 Tax=Duganella sp. Root336D2 TaxID=1736518 RepID=UPI000B074ABE|nr:hypothetical protein [Duganella sp. Root336D2]
MTTSSVCKKVIDRMVAALVNATGAGDRVFDSREAAIARDEMPCIAITPPDSEDTQAFAQDVDQNTALVTMEVIVRDDDWRPLADDIAVAAHRVLSCDSELQALVVSLRKDGRKWAGAEADQTAGIDSITYRVTYLSLSNDLTSTI